MAIQILNPGKIIDIVAAGTVTVNTLDVVQNLVGIYMKSGSTSDTIPFMISGLWKGVDKKDGTGLTWTAGQRLYFDDTTEQEFKTTATGGLSAQQNIVAGAAATATATTGTVLVGFGA